MALKTQKPSFSSTDMGEQISTLISYVEELANEIEFKFEILSGAVEKLRQIISKSAEGSD